MNYMTKTIAAGFIYLTLFSSCFTERQAYFLAPQNAAANPYHAMPMKSDSLKSAFYANGVYTNGSANDRQSDHVWSLEGSLHRSHNFGIFQAYYGANLTLGSYNISDYYRSDYRYSGGFIGTYYPVDTPYHIAATNKFFGAYGVSGGINLVMSHEHKKYNKHSEWRALGLETSLQNEFGEYNQFRKNLSDTGANVNFRNSFSAYLGLYTEWVWTSRYKTEGGVKLAWGLCINPENNYLKYLDRPITPLLNFSVNWHVTRNRYTGFMQINLGTYADNIQFGLTYRLTKKKAGQ